MPEDSDVATFDECLGVFAHNDEVVAALERYNAAADVLAATLLATDPETGDPSTVLSAWAAVVAAALDLVALFPEGQTLARQLEQLTDNRRK